MKGIATVTAKGRAYHYAWRGGPRLKGAPGSPEFMRGYHEAIENRRTPDTSRFRSLVTLYKASAAYMSLSASTKENWSPCLDRIAENFGELRIAQFDRPEKIRPVIRQWRERFATTPRTADYNMQVLSRVLSHALEHGKIARKGSSGYIAATAQRSFGPQPTLLISRRAVAPTLPMRSISPRIPA